MTTKLRLWVKWIPAYAGMTLFLNTVSCFSQTDSLKRTDSIDNSDEAIEKLIENQTIDVEDSRLLDYLKKLQSDPIDINTATSEKLESIPFINAVISKRIVNYRTKYGKFSDITMLKKVEG